jgi:hypothetical protein
MQESPIIFCGCHGGGTSFVARLMRHAGLFMGVDAGSIHARKYHESDAFRMMNMRVLQRFGDVNGMLQPCVLEVTEYLRHRENVIKVAKLIDRERVLAAFWGSENRNRAWGWKDPRNSLIFPVWKAMFPSARAVVLRKTADNSRSKSGSGYWFRHVAPDVVRAAYTTPYWIAEQNGVLVTSFERITSNVDDFNQLMAFCGLPEVTTTSFAGLLKDSQFEPTSRFQSMWNALLPKWFVHMLPRGHVIPGKMPGSQKVDPL